MDIINPTIEEIIQFIDTYYSAKILKHGPVPAGADWNGIQSQYIRFEQLCKIIDYSYTFSLNDLGCGYGALLDYLEKEFNGRFTYFGYDVSADMIKVARKCHSNKARINFQRIFNNQYIERADFTVASGIFNVKGQFHDKHWLQYVLDSIRSIDKYSNKGFSFNMLTKYSDRDHMLDHLYYADPLYLFDFCKRHFSQNVDLLHGYSLYEFTLLVKKSSAG